MKSNVAANCNDVNSDQFIIMHPWPLLNLVVISMNPGINATISWLPLLISQLISPRLLNATHFFTAQLFLNIFHFVFAF